MAPNLAKLGGPGNAAPAPDHPADIAPQPDRVGLPTRVRRRMVQEIA